MDRRTFITVASATLGISLLAGCGSSDTEYEEGNSDGGSDGDSDEGGGSEESGDDGGSESDKKLEILDHEMVRENEGDMSETVKVEGTAENVSGGNLGYAEVRAKFYDDSGALLESFMDNVNDLGAGEKWSFEIHYPGLGEDAREVADYEVGAGTNF